jgi:hypothetical protein
MREKTRVECGTKCGKKRGIFCGMGAGHVFVCVTCAYMRDVWIRARDGEIDVSDAEMALQALRKALALLGRPAPGAWGATRHQM